MQLYYYMQKLQTAGMGNPKERKECPICGKTLYDRSTWNRHMRIHTGEIELANPPNFEPITPLCLRRKAIPVPLLWSQIPNELQQARAREEMPGPARPCHPHTLDAGEPERGAERRLQITPAGNNNNNNQCSSKPSPTTQPKKSPARQKSSEPNQ